MPVFLVNVSPRAQSHDYSALWKALSAVKAQEVMDAQWVVDVAQDLKTVTNVLLSHCNTGDGLFVVELAAETRWTGTGLSAAGKAWFGARAGTPQLPMGGPSIDPAPALAPVEPRHLH